ncbi:FAD-dependent oxidoreductase [Phormidium tenue FACHB-886]|nr:FAD-dependent oxidoreductase [Phormidium tenue FACHB-886]
MTASPPSRTFDFVGFGDEVPGILALVSAAREYRRRTGTFAKSVVMLKGNAQEGIGGHLVRGRLAYVDRSSIPIATRNALRLDDFGDPPAIYKEFLQRAGVKKVALDPGNANSALRSMMGEAGVNILSNVKIKAVRKDGQRLAGLELTNGAILLGQQFVDSTVNAELAQLAGVKKLPGYAGLGLPNAELAVTLMFETQGISPQMLQEIELAYLKRYANPNDTEAQQWINTAAQGDASLAQYLRNSLTRGYGQLNKMDVGTDYIDVYSRALSIAYHSFRGKKHYLPESGVVFDNANIAVLPGNRMIWNCLLFYVNAAEAEALARNGAKPTPAMIEEIKYVDRWFKSLGATVVKAAPELYIRHAGNIVGAVDPLSGAQMIAGGVPAAEAIGTFGYAFDIRGGVKGLWERAAEVGVKKFAFKSPLLNVGMRHALIKAVPNLAVISPASGFSGSASAVGRIVEFNAAVAQGVGIAAAIAQLSGRNLADIANEEVRAVLQQLGKLPKIYGRYDANETSSMSEFEQRMFDVKLAIPLGFEELFA